MTVADLVDSVPLRFAAPEAFDHAGRYALGAEHQGQRPGIALAMSLLDIPQEILGRIEGLVLPSQIERVGVFAGILEVIAKGTSQHLAFGRQQHAPVAVGFAKPIIWSQLEAWLAGEPAD